MVATIVATREVPFSSSRASVVELAVVVRSGIPASSLPVGVSAPVVVGVVLVGVVVVGVVVFPSDVSLVVVPFVASVEVLEH